MRSSSNLIKRLLIYFVLGLFLVLLIIFGKNVLATNTFEDNGVIFQYPKFFKKVQNPDMSSQYVFLPSSIWPRGLNIFFASLIEPLGQTDSGQRSLVEYVGDQYILAPDDKIKVSHGPKTDQFQTVLIVDGSESYDKDGLGGMNAVFNVENKVYSYSILFTNTGMKGFINRVVARLVMYEFIDSLKIDSSKASVFAAEDAQEIVELLPEVREWGNKVGWLGAHIIAEQEINGKWMVHVYEAVRDHTATFNWFYVDKKTGEVSKEFEY